MQVQPRNNYISSEYSGQSKVQDLKRMLELNRSAQEKLKSVLQSIQVRKTELEELGLGQRKVQEIIRENTIQYLYKTGKVPEALSDQLQLKKTKQKDYRFTQNIIDKPFQKKPRKIVHLDPSTLSRNPKNINFVQLAQKCTNYDNGLQIYQAWRRVNRGNIFSQKNKILNEKQQELLLEKKKIFGDNWEKICTFFDGYSFQDLYYFYQKNLSNTKSGRWNYTENIKLIILTQYFGEGKWASISKVLRVKSQFQVRQRFCNILNPRIVQNKWTGDEGELLLQKAKQYKYEWSKITKQVEQFKKKTDNALRRKFRNMMCQLTNQQIERQLQENKKLAKSILRFKECQKREKKSKEEKKGKNKEKKSEEKKASEIKREEIKMSELKQESFKKEKPVYRIV